MNAENKRWIQLALAIAIVVAAARTTYILYERHTASAAHTAQPAPPLNPDYYVIPKKLHPYDLKSAKQLTEQPVWVKEGYRYTYYPYVNGRVDFRNETGQLLPIERLQIKNVVLEPTPGASGQKQLMAAFEKDGKSYAVPIGTESGGDYQIYSDEMFFIQDPRELYKHWPAEVWQAIDNHQVKPGMNELQADFAIGMGTPERSSDPDTKTVNYPHGGSPLTVTYRYGKAAEIRQEAGPGTEH